MKQVLLIGDSIRMGYCQEVKKQLSERAEVFYPDENCRSSQNIMMSIALWARLCEKQNVGVVYWNCGHWDATHFNGDPESLTSLSEYEKNLGAISGMLKRLFPNAKLVFATTTPMNPTYPDGKSMRTTEEIMAYNDVAKRTFEGTDVLLDDLFAQTQGWGAEYYADYAHFTSEGSALLGKHVADVIAGLL